MISMMRGRTIPNQRGRRRLAAHDGPVQLTLSRVVPPVSSGGGLLVYPARPAAARSAVTRGRIHDRRNTCPWHTRQPHRRVGQAQLSCAARAHARQNGRPDPGGRSPASYLANAEAAAESGVTADDIQGHDRGCPDCRDGQGGLGRREDPQGLGLAIAVADSEMAVDGTPGSSSRAHQRRRQRIGSGALGNCVSGDADGNSLTVARRCGGGGRAGAGWLCCLTGPAP